MEYVYSTEYQIVIVEEDSELDNDFHRYLVYVEGEWVGTAFDLPEAREMASEALAAVAGEPQSEEGDPI